MFLQTKESPYIEAAKAYGAGDTRIIFQYMLPRVIPVLIPQFILLIPSYVFLEASLAILGLGDPVLPTWGKIINDSYANGALYNGWYYWVLEPSVLLMFTGLAFAMVGFALDRIFNPRLRGQ
jgi:peptide/nickel transport system permease protein